MKPSNNIAKNTRKCYYAGLAWHEQLDGADWAKAIQEKYFQPLGIDF
jgi:hypothetical protein